MTLTLDEVFKKIFKTLKSERIENPGLEANMIISYVLKMSNEKIFIQKERRIYKKTLNRICKLINKRIKGIPMAYLLKNAYFYSNKFLINNNVLIPRPETELLVEQAYESIKNKKDQQILDL